MTAGDRSIFRGKRFLNSPGEIFLSAGMQTSLATGSCLLTPIPPSPAGRGRAVPGYAPPPTTDTHLIRLLSDPYSESTRSPDQVLGFQVQNLCSKSKYVLVPFSTSKKIAKLPALEYAIIPRVWLDSLELIQSHKNSISIQLFPYT